MKTTDDEILRLLPRFNCAVKRRTLVNWRQNHLLPKLLASGRGQGKGKTYFYGDMSVIRQICAVKQLLNSVRRMNELYVPLWLLGYDVDYRLVRRQVTRYIRDLLKDLTQGARSQSVTHLEDHLFELSNRNWMKMMEMQNDPSHNKYSADATIAYFSRERFSSVLMALLAPEVSSLDLSTYDEEEKAPMILEFQAKWHKRHITMEEATKLANGFIPQLHILREWVSPHSLLTTMKRAKKDDWIRTQLFIRNCAGILWDIYKAYKTNPPDPYAPSERDQCGKDLLHVGRISVAIGLMLVQRGYSESIENILNVVSRSMLEKRSLPT